jgi:hypothetical protein
MLRGQGVFGVGSQAYSLLPSFTKLFLLDDTTAKKYAGEKTERRGQCSSASSEPSTNLTSKLDFVEFPN